MRPTLRDGRPAAGPVRRARRGRARWSWCGSPTAWSRSSGRRARTTAGDGWWVLSDNAARGVDSWHRGPIADDDVLAVVLRAGLAAAAPRCDASLTSRPHRSDATGTAAGRSPLCTRLASSAGRSSARYPDGGRSWLHRAHARSRSTRTPATPSSTLHVGGKMEIASRRSPLNGRDELSLAYTPGCGPRLRGDRRGPDARRRLHLGRRTPSPSSPTAPPCSGSATSARPPRCR